VTVKASRGVKRAAVVWTGANAAFTLAGRLGRRCCSTVPKGWFITTAGFREVTITPAGWRALHLHFQLAERSSRMINECFYVEK
jgi:hypothetical protein